jgi:hypothetical protein
MIIGLCGRKGCGKSSVADSMERVSGFKSYNFASPIRKALGAMGIPEDMLNDPKLKERPTNYVFGNKTPRQLMQLLGTEFGRDLVSKSIWVDHLVERIRKSGAKNIVIDDVRFDNEVEALKLEGAYIVEVRRDDSFYKRDDVHISEHGVSDDLIDTAFDNISCYQTDLDRSVESLVNSLAVRGVYV